MGSDRNKYFLPQARVWVGLFVLTAALHALNVGANPASNELDPSWTAVLGWATAHGLQFGDDIVFTYGPLGFLHPHASYVAEIYPIFLIGQLSLTLLLAVSCYAVVSRLSLRLRVLYCAAAIACAPWTTPDTLWLLFLAQNGVALCIPVLGRESNGNGQCPPIRSTSLLLPLVLGAGSAAVALLKFSMLPVALITVAAACAALALERRGAHALAHLIGFVAGATIIWLAAGQAFANLPVFLIRSTELAAAYGDAMGLMPRLRVDLLGFTSLAISGGWLGWQMLSERQRPARALVLFALGCVAFVAWRQGFTRADGHIHQLFPLLVLLPLLGIALYRQLGRLALLCGLGAMLTALVVGLGLARSQLSAARWSQVVERMPQVISAYAHPVQLIRQREAKAEHLRSLHPLTEIRELVGMDSVDILNWEQGILILHRMNYRPRPVFQSYSANSPRLLRINEAHFLNTEAPRYVLLKLQTIDGRLPSGDDALALIGLLRAYNPVLESSGYLLFERAVSTEFAPLPKLALAHEERLGEWIELPTGVSPQVFGVDVRPTLLGRLYAFWFRTPPLLLEVETAAGVRSTFRLQPNVSATGFLLNPLLRNTKQLSSFYKGQGAETVRRVRVLSADPNFEMMWNAKIDIGYGTFQWLRPDPAPVGLRSPQ